MSRSNIDLEVMIDSIVEQALKTQHLTEQAKHQLQKQLTQQLSLKEIDALIKLQEAMKQGHIQQESYTQTIL